MVLVYTNNSNTTVNNISISSRTKSSHTDPGFAMSIYSILSKSSLTLVENMFTQRVIDRSLPYINNFSIEEVSYDAAHNMLMATIMGTERYTVIITEDDTIKKTLSTRCNCPAYKGPGYPCKHIAAVLILIIDYFNFTGYVPSYAKNYYTDLLDDLFSDIPENKEQIIPELHVAPVLLPQFVKPTIIFVKNPLDAYPAFLLIDDAQQATKYHSIVKEPANTLDSFQLILTVLFKDASAFDFFAYTSQGLQRLEYTSSKVLQPEWNIQCNENTVDIKLIDTNDSAAHACYIPLGHTHAINTSDNTIVGLKVANIAYSYLNEALSNMCITVDNYTELSVDNRVKNRIVEASKLKRILNKTESLKPFKSRISVKYFNEALQFWDTGNAQYLQHLVIVDPHGALLPIDSIVSQLEVQISEDRNTHLFKLIALASHENGSLPANAIRAKKEYSTFFNNLALQCQSADALQAQALVEAICSFIHDARIDNLVAETRLLTKRIKDFKFIDQKALLQNVQDLWQSVYNTEFIAITYRSDIKRIRKVAYREKDVIYAMLSLLAYGLLHDSNCDLRDPFSMGMFDSSQFGSLNEYLQKREIALYIRQKKVKAGSFDIHLDVSSHTTDWFSLKPDFYNNDALLSEDEWQKLLGATSNLYETDDNVYLFDAKTQEMLDSLRILKDELQKNPKEKKQRSYFKVPRLHIFTLLACKNAGITLKLSPEDQQVLSGLENFTTIEPTALPEHLTCNLRAYQIQGYNWLSFLYRHKFGACLADDMGLGKTVQAITLLAGLHEGKIKPDMNSRQLHLVVAPASVIGNWEHEIKKMYPHFSTTLYLGPKRTMQFTDTDIVLSTYDTVRSDYDELKKIPFHVVIFDEAQAIKNRQSLRANAALQLRATFKICLTGTPLENNIHELCSIMNLAVPGILPEGEEINRLIKNNEYDLISKKIAPFMLRRTKKEYLLDLPEKTENNIMLDMSKEQRRLYGAIVDEIKQEVYMAYREKTSAQAGIIALTALLRLRQICVSPELLKGSKSSPKLEYLLQEIEKKIQLKVSCLIFSQFTSALDILMRMLDKNGIKYIRIDGSVPALSRKKIIEEFQTNKEIFVMILSLKAGGVGLNLTKAQVVYHLDPWWNPSVENQASDRVHRIGQEHEVSIIRLIMRDSVEEKMLILKQKKQELFDAVMKGVAGAHGTTITKTDFDFLLN